MFTARFSVNMRILELFVLFSILCSQALGQSCITGDLTCNSAETYCYKDGTCRDVGYKALVKTKGKPATKDKTAFHLIVFSDIQYYFLICKENPKEECIYHDFDGTRNERRRLLEAAAARQAKCVVELSKKLKDVKGVVHNGDITNRGLEREVIAIEEFHDKLQDSIPSMPFLVALGNHDYYLGDNASSVRVISYYERTLRELSKRVKLRSIDYNTTGVVYNSATKRNEKYTRGSLCYSVEFNGYVFIILNWATALRFGEYTAKFEAYDSRNNANHYIDVTPVTEWLKAELASAKKKKRKVILVPHAWTGLRLYTRPVSDISDVLYHSTLIAVLSGHVHDAWGFDNNWEVGSGENTRTVPVYYAGSASYEKLIAVKMKARKKGIVVKAYDTKTDSCTKADEESTRTD